MAVLSDDATADVTDDAGSMNDNYFHCMSVICENDLVGQTFLMDPMEDGQWHCVSIVEIIQVHEHDLKMADHHYKFRISINDD